MKSIEFHRLPSLFSGGERLHLVNNNVITDSSVNRLQIAHRYIMEHTDAVFEEITAVFVAVSRMMHTTQIMVAQCVTARIGNICGK